MSHQRISLLSSVAKSTSRSFSNSRSLGHSRGLGHKVEARGPSGGARGRGSMAHTDSAVRLKDRWAKGRRHYSKLPPYTGRLASSNSLPAQGLPARATGDNSSEGDTVVDVSAVVKEGKKSESLSSDGELVVPADIGVISEAWSRGRWLLGLLVLQSTSSVVLDKYQQLLKDHLVVTLFLTMLVGAGGNAGNQSAIKVIRGLATGTIKTTRSSIKKVIVQQAAVGGLLGGGLAGGGWIRVYITNGDAWNATAISISLLCIVFTSVVMGASLPFGLARLGVDPANAGTTIQVIMDILGVTITCATCHFVLDQLAYGLT